MHNPCGTTPAPVARRRTPARTGPRVWLLVWRKMVTVETSSGAGQPVWTRTLIGWHVVFWVLLAMTLVLSFSGDLDRTRQVVFVGAVAVLGAAYQFIGLPAIGSRRALPSYAYRLRFLRGWSRFSRCVYRNGIG